MGFADQILKAQRQIFAKIGRNDILWTESIKTLDEMGRPSLKTDSAPKTIIGDIQAVTASDTQILDQGIAKIGDFKLFADFDIDFQPIDIQDLDKISADDREYEVIQKIEEHIIEGQKVHQSWVLRLRP